MPSGGSRWCHNLGCGHVGEHDRLGFNLCERCCVRYDALQSLREGSDAGRDKFAAKVIGASDWSNASTKPYIFVRTYYRPRLRTADFLVRSLGSVFFILLAQEEPRWENYMLKIISLGWLLNVLVGPRGSSKIVTFAEKKEPEAQCGHGLVR